MSGYYDKENLTSKYTGSNNNEGFKTDMALNWIIWSIDDNKIRLISDKPIQNGGYKNLGAISFANCNGYNNAVKILNDICKSCYSNEKLNAIARSINVDDIEKVLNKNFWSPENYKVAKTNAHTYSSRKEYKVTKCYPIIFKDEQYSVIDGIEKIDGINKSEQNDLIYEKIAYLKAEKSLNPMQTSWTKSKMNEKNFTSEKYYQMLFRDMDNELEELMSYFLASRGVNLNENHAQFGLFEVGMGSTIKTNTVFNSLGGSLEYWDRIRPMVEIPINNIRIDRSNDGLTKDTAWIIESK